jgi:structural maintenance of chromosome 2
LNGSGKSNILDSICFVLGITNLTQVRAKSLQELVYKNGQAGVTKATVSIVFDNTDKAGSPVGYADQDEITVTRQVVIGGKNKYLINGHNAQKGRVENFFHSVQLNVNNPHFLIMQGRITKVLNMKPPEILSMIEEAAGTRMYETKKAGSLQVMEKKQQKMEEIDRMLTEEIQPTLEKLRRERSAFFEWQKNGMEIDHLKRLVTAYQFMQADAILKTAKAELEALEAQVQELTTSMESAKREKVNCEQNIGIVEKKKEAEMGGGLQDLEEQANELSKAVVKANEKFKGKTQDRVAEEKNKKAAIAAVDTGASDIKAAETNIDTAKVKFEAAAEAQQGCEDALAEQERKLHAIAMGMSEVDGEEAKTFADQQKDAKSDAIAAESEIQQATLRIKHQTPALKEKKTAAKESEKEYAKMSASLKVDEKAMGQIKAKMDTCDFNEEKEEALEKERAGIEHEANKLRDRTDNLGAKLSNMQFKYSNPEPGFDRSKVYGRVAELVTVNKPETMAALEQTAGGKLFNVVVDDEVTGKKLLSKGKLSQRVTILPLNKIASREIRADKVKLAESVGGAANVDTAISLVKYNKDVDAAMKHVFGGNFICKDMDVAKKVTFHEKIKTKSVTLDGDVTDPSGTLSGGAAKKSAPILAVMHEYKIAKARLTELEAALVKIDKDLSILRASKSKYDTLKEQYDLKAHQVELNRSRIEQSTCSQVLKEVSDLEASIVDSKAALKACEQKKKDVVTRLASIEKEMKQAKAEQENKTKAVEKQIVVAKKALTAAKAATAKAKQAADESVLELEAAKAELVNLENQVGSFDADIARLQGEEDVLAAVLVEARERFDNTSAEVTERRNKVKACENEIHDLTKKVAALTKLQSKGEVDLKKVKNTIAGLDKKKSDASAAVKHMVQEHPWINDEKKDFGKAGTAFEFKKGDAERDPAKCAKKLEMLMVAQEKLSKSVNMKVMSMFDKTEKSSADLLRRKKIVEADRDKIQLAISELDIKKNEALEKAYGKVNKDFGSIFSALLPGTSAQLAPVAGKSVLDGLQVRVAFGSIWKESLTELSGGQRSLVALSLILSLLLFKPAPLYILDEIDAALDLSHTQNIGQMLKAHFKQSQFIVVSLKEGMFNNANVLFKTAFVDGVSTVRRFAQNVGKVPRALGPAAKENVKPTKGKAAAGGGTARSGRGIAAHN